MNLYTFTYTLLRKVVTCIPDHLRMRSDWSDLKCLNASWVH